MTRLTSRFTSNASGNVALMFAGTLSVLLCLGGLVVDYAVAVHRKKSLDAASDTAIMAGVRAASVAKEQGRSDWEKIGVDQANALMRANLPPGKNYALDDYEPVISLEGTTVRGVATYTGRSYTSLMRIFGYDNVRLTGQNKAETTAGQSIDVHFVIDASSSMGIGAEVGDQIIMQQQSRNQLLPQGCAFACHYSPTPGKEVGLTPAQARSAGAKLRIDIAAQAVRNAVSELKAKSNGKVRVAIYVFANQLRTVIPLTNNLSLVETRAQSIDLESTIGFFANGGTYITGAIQDVHTIVKANKTSSAPHIILMSDGIEDTASSMILSRMVITKPSARPATRAVPQDSSTLQTFSPTPCNQIKTDGMKLLAVQIQYTAAVGFRPRPEPDLDKVEWILNVLGVSTVAQAFKSCVSDPASDYVLATTSTAIGPMLSKLMDRVVFPAVVRLSE